MLSHITQSRDQFLLVSLLTQAHRASTVIQTVYFIIVHVHKRLYVYMLLACFIGKARITAAATYIMHLHTCILHASDQFYLSLNSRI